MATAGLSRTAGQQIVDRFDDVLSAVGPRLRALRTRRETTLAAVSEDTGTAPAMDILMPL